MVLSWGLNASIESLVLCGHIQPPPVGLAAGHRCLRLAGPALPESGVISGEG